MKRKIIRCIHCGKQKSKRGEVCEKCGVKEDEIVLIEEERRG